MYYEKFPLEVDCSPIKLKEWMEKAMEQVKKDHYFVFCKHLLVCDPTFGMDFLKEIQVHYDMNFKLEMLIEKLQMLAYARVFLEQKLTWLKQWNESSVIRKAKKFPTFGFMNVQFDKWFHKATFWHHVNILIQFSLWIFPILLNCFDTDINFLSHVVEGGSSQALCFYNKIINCQKILGVVYFVCYIQGWRQSIWEFGFFQEFKT